MDVIKRVVWQTSGFRKLYDWGTNKIGYLGFLNDYRRFKKMARGDTRLPMEWKDRYPCLRDKTAVASFDRHYLYHTAWAARVLAQLQPPYHVDISSFLYFSTLVSAFIPIHFYDLRPAEIKLDNFISGWADLLHLPFEDESLPSLSCMHVLEHVGLGRYGDALDPNGDLKAMSELQRVLAPGGSLLLVVPVGKPRIMFNAHRIYSYTQVISYFPDLDLKEFALIPDRDDAGGKGIIPDAPAELAQAQEYGCGCFHFVKKMPKE